MTSKQNIQSYRLNSLEDPTDEMLHALMEQVAASARRSSEKAKNKVKERLAALRTKH